MRRYPVVLGTISGLLLMSAVASWPCCGQGTEPIQVDPIVAEPNPVACDNGVWAPVQITYTVMVTGYEWDVIPQGTWGPTYADVIVGGTTIEAGVYVTGMSGAYTLSTSWTPTEAGSFLVQIKAYNEAGTVTILQPGPDIVVESCCAEGMAVRITPETLNVQRAGNYVMGHLDGAVSGTIVSIGGIATSIAGTADAGGPIRFSSEEVCSVAAQIVPAGGPRAEDVEIVVVAELADGQSTCGDAGDLIDIINEGKKSGK